MKKFNKIFNAVFMAFLFLTLSFGRAFSIINIKGLFVTEIVLLMGVLFIFFNRRDIAKIPRIFLIFLSVYFVFGGAYFLKGIFEKNVYALRDVVFFAYTLFVPLVFLFFPDREKLRKFLFILIAANVVGLISARFHFSPAVSSKRLEESIGIIRAFNYLLYSGMALSFLISWFYFVKTNGRRILITVLCAFNIYSSVFLAERSGWVALFTLFVFMALFFRKRFWRFCVYFLASFLIISAVFLAFIDSYYFKSVFLPKLTSTGMFIRNRVLSGPQENKIQVSKKFIEDWGFKEDSGTFEVSEGVKGDREYTFYVNLGWRLEMWRLAMEFGSESAVIGKGFGTSFISPARLRTARQVGVSSDYIPAHNHILSIFYKMGIIGLALFFFINIYAFLYGFGYMREAGSNFTKFFLLGCLGSLIYWHVLAFFVNAIDSPPTSIFLWIIVGLIFVSVRADHETENQST